MPVKYDIFPELNLIIYVATGTVTPAEFFSIGDKALQDTRLQAKTKVILDFFNADIETNVSDIRLAIFKHNEAKQIGKEVGQTAVYTKSAALKFLGETLRHLSFDAVNDFGIFHNQHDAIHWLGLPEEEVKNCWAQVIEEILPL